MGNNTTKTFTIKVDDKGSIIGVTEKMEGLNKASGKVAAAQDKLAKGSAGFAKNATADFAKISQGMGGLVHIYATVAANVFALSSAYQVLKSNADLQIMQKAAADLSRSTGINLAKVAKDMKEVTNGALNMKEAMQAANLGISGGATKTQLIGIAEAATKAANTLGRSVPEAVTRMTQAVIKAEPELVDEFGIILRVREATEDYARAHGKAASELNTFEKSQAIINQLLTQAKSKYADVNKYTNEFERLGASFNEMAQSIMSVLSGPLGNVAGFIADNIEYIALLIALLVKSIASKAIPLLTDFSKRFVTTTEEMAIATRKSITKQRKEIELLNDEFAHVSKTTKGFAKGITKLVKAGKIPATIRTELGKAVKDGLNPEEVLKAMQTTFNNSLKDFKKQAILAAASGAEYSNITYKQGGKEKTTRLSKSEAEFISTVIHRAGLDISKYNLALEQAEYLTQKLKATSAVTFKSIGLQLNVLKLTMIRSFAAGFKGGFSEILTTVNRQFKKIDNKATGLANKLHATFAGVGAGAGALVSGVTKLVSGFIQVSFVATIALEIFKGLAEWTGLWNTESEKAAEKVDEISKNTEELRKITKSLAVARGEGFSTFKQEAENADAIYKNSLDYLENINNLFKEGQNIGKGFFNNIVDAINIFDGFESDLDRFTSTMQSNIRQLSILTGKPINFDIEIPDFTIKTLGYYKYIKAQKLSFKELLKRQDILELLQDNEEAWLKVQTQIEQKIKDTTKPLEEYTLAIKSASSAIDRLNKRSTEYINSVVNKSPFAKDLKDLLELQKTYKVIEKQKGKSAADRSLVLDTSSGTKAFLGITDEVDAYDQLIDKTNELLRKTSETVDLDNQKLAVQSSLVILKDKEQKGSIDALEQIRQSNIKILDIENKKLGTQKENLLNLRTRLEADYEGKDLAVFTRLINAQIAEIELKRANNIVKANTEYSKQKTILAQISKIIKVSNIKFDIKKSINESKEKLAFEKAKNAELLKSTRLSALNTAYTIKQNNLQAEIANNLKNIELYSKVIKQSADDQNTALEYSKQLEQERSKLLENKQELQNLSLDKAKDEYNIIKGTSNLLVLQLELNKKALEITKSIAESQTDKFGIDYKSKAENLKLINSLTEKITESQISYNNEIIKSKKETLALLIREKQLDQEGTKKKKLQNEIALLELDNLKTKNDLLDAELKLREQIFENQKASVQIDSIFSNTEESMNLIRKNFALAALDFSENLKNPIDALTDGITSAIDNSLDGFINAIKNGENALYAAAKAFGETVYNATLEFTKDLLKDITRKLFVGLVGGDVKKSKQEILLQENIGKNNTRNILLENILTELKSLNLNINNGTGFTPINKTTTDLLDASDFIDPLDKAGDNFAESAKQGIDEQTSATNKMLTGIFNGSSSVMQNVQSVAITAMQSVTQAILTSMTTQQSGALSGIFDSLLSGLFGGPNLGGGAAAGAFGLSNGAIVNPSGVIYGMATGGIVNELQPIKAYANGGITNGPELALIGEGPKREAIVPLPDNKSVPVEFIGDSKEGDNIQINVYVTGVQGTEQGLRQSAGQVGLQVATALRRASRRNG